MYFNSFAGNANYYGTGTHVVQKKVLDVAGKCSYQTTYTI